MNLFAALLIALGCARADSLDAVLARMDQAARSFQSLTANLKQVTYSSVLDQSTDKSGTVHLKRAKNGVVDLTQFPDEMLFVEGRTAERYFPKGGTVEIYNTGKFTATMDQVILAGFGSTSAELRRSYDIKLGGAETIGQTHTTRIELTPKSNELKKMITRMDLWIPDGQGYPIQQKGLEPNQDYVLVTYSDVQVNPNLPDSAFQLTLPAGVKKLYPQK